MVWPILEAFAKVHSFFPSPRVPPEMRRIVSFLKPTIQHKFHFATRQPGERRGKRVARLLRFL